MMSGMQFSQTAYPQCSHSPNFQTNFRSLILFPQQSHFSFLGVLINSGKQNHYGQPYRQKDRPENPQDFHCVSGFLVSVVVQSVSPV